MSEDMMKPQQDAEKALNLRQLIVEFTIPKSGFKPLSWLIRLISWEWWKGVEWVNVPSHVRIRFFDKKHQVWWVYEASGSMLKFIGYDYISGQTKVIKEYPIWVDADTKLQFIRHVNKNTGKPYGKLQLIGLGVVKFMKVFGVRVKNPLADGGKTQICTEAISLLLVNQAKFKTILSRYELDSIDLIDLNKAMEECYGRNN